MFRSKLSLIIIVFSLLAFIFCGGNTNTTGNGTNNNTDDGTEQQTEVVTDTPTDYDKYFSDETPVMWNNIWVDHDDTYNYDTVIGITSVEMGEFEGNSVLVVKYRNMVSFSYGQAWGQDKKVVSIRQNGEKFKCLGGEGLTDFNGATYTPYEGLTPTTIPKDKFEEILGSASDSDKELLLTYYETGLPTELEGLKMDTLLNNATEEQKALLEASYTKSGELDFSPYAINEAIEDEDLLLDTISSIECSFWSSQKFTYDYKDSYVIKYDLHESAGLRTDIGITVVPIDAHNRLKELFFNVGFIPSLEWLEYFELKSKNDVEFDMTQPFDLKEACSTGCMRFNDVWVNPPQG